MRVKLLSVCMLLVLLACGACVSPAGAYIRMETPFMTTCSIGYVQPFTYSDLIAREMNSTAAVRSSASGLAIAFPWMANGLASPLIAQKADDLILFDRTYYYSDESF